MRAFGVDGALALVLRWSARHYQAVTGVPVELQVGGLEEELGLARRLGGAFQVPGDELEARAPGDRLVLSVRTLIAVSIAAASDKVRLPSTGLPLTAPRYTRPD